MDLNNCSSSCVRYISLIKTRARTRPPPRAFLVLDLKKISNTLQDFFTINDLTDSCARVKMVEEAFEVYGDISKEGLEGCKVDLKVLMSA